MQMLQLALLLSVLARRPAAGHQLAQLALLLSALARTASVRNTSPPLGASGWVVRGPGGPVDPGPCTGSPPTWGEGALVREAFSSSFDLVRPGRTCCARAGS